MKKYGFIGTGNMGSALAEAIVKKVGPENVMLNDYDMSKAEKLAGKLSASTGTKEELAAFADSIFIGVKPQALESMFSEFRKILSDSGRKVTLISMAAGTSIEKITKLAGDYPVIRIMPNVACSIGEGMTLCCSNDLVSEEEMAGFISDMSLSGRCETIPEKLIDAASAVTGCGPAYVFMMAEAMADGAVACGIPRDKAYTFAAQTLLGGGKLILESGKTPAELKDSVCSPGGTTIEGVAKLEEGGLRAAVISAVRAAYEKNFKL